MDRPDPRDGGADAAEPAPRRGRRALVRLGALAGLAYAGGLGLLWAGQERLLFAPVALDPDTPLAREPDVHEHFVDVPGARLSVLELRLRAPTGVVFYLHGNGGNLRDWFVNADFYRRAGFDLVMLDYRGYGKSGGRIESEAQLHADVDAVWRAVASRYRGARVVVFGRSLGSGLAAALAARVQPDLTILVSPFSSMAALAAEHYPWVPTALLRYPLRSDEAIGALRAPVLLIHGERDTLIPPSHSRVLQARARDARLVVVSGAAHNDLQQFATYLDAISGALASLR